MSFQDKLYELVQHLFLGTAQGTIKWTETADEDTFRAVLNTGLVRVERRFAPTSSPTVDSASQEPRGLNLPKKTFPIDDFEYCLLVLDERNKEIGRFVPERLEHAMTLRNLWELAQRSARNAEEKIDSLLREVEGKVARK